MCFYSEVPKKSVKKEGRAPTDPLASYLEGAGGGRTSLVNIESIKAILLMERTLKGWLVRGFSVVEDSTERDIHFSSLFPIFRGPTTHPIHGFLYAKYKFVYISG